MKDQSLTHSTLRASRLLSCAVLVLCAVALAIDYDAFTPGIVLAAPLVAICLGTLALASLLATGSRALQVTGQLLAALAGAAALAAELPPWFPEGMPGATRLTLAGTALALLMSPARGRVATQVFATAAVAGLILVATSLVGAALGNAALARLGFERDPLILITVASGVLLLSVLAQRGDAGWFSVLLGASAAGAVARGIIAWTILAPLGLAVLALAGVRAGYFSLDFAFALLAAAMCCGLTLLVVWNAARQDSAQRRAASEREATARAANRLRLAKSATGLQLWEWTPSSREWVSIDGEEHLDPAANEYLEAGIGRCLRDGQAEFEFALRRPGQEEQWLLATCWREQRDGRPVVVGINVDITERKLAALALETSETRLQLAARALPGFVYDWNCGSGKMLRTSGIEQLLGFRGAEISPVSRWWEDLVHPDDRALARPARVTRVSGPDSGVESIACEYRVRHKNGNYLWIWDHCVLVRDRAGAVTRVVGSVLDITERKEAEARLSASEHRFKAALLATAGIIWTKDADGRMAGEQTSWSAFTGQSSDELSGLGWTAALHPDDVPATLEAWRRALATGEDLVLVHRVRRRDGAYRIFSVHAVPVTNERGETVEWVGSHTDITLQRELEAGREALLSAERAARGELVAAAQAKDEFLATISHELRTPLNAILGWTTLLQRPKVDPATFADGLRVIERNARAQTQLLGDLLDANQLMSGKLSLSFEPMDLNDAVRATLDSMRVTIAARKISIDAQVSDAPLPVMGDSGRLQQIVSNLLSNAIKFTPAGGVVTLATGSAAEMAYLEVRDSGEGISEEFLPHIFEKFRQAESGSARRHAGLGLGLAITKQLVESHGGSIAVNSAGRGQGATFAVQLPRLKPEDGQLAEFTDRHVPRPHDKPLAGLRILAVDDESDSREYLERLLSEQGAEIVSVASAAEALDALTPDTGRFNLLVSDLGMPGSTGYDLIEAIREELHVDEQHLPAVALTAFSRPQDSALALDRGFQKHLAKPVEVGRLIGAIRQLTGRSRAPRALRARRH